MKTKTKPTVTLRSLKTELTNERAASAALRAELEDANNQLAGFRAAQTKHEAELNEYLQRFAVARAALLPFGQKTADWQWPPLEVEAWRPLLWGDLKRAADASAEFR